MECDVYYQHHPPYEGTGDRCAHRSIAAGTAQQVALLGMFTSFSGVLNLFVCGYLIKIWGSRWAFVSQTSLLALRVASQAVGVTIGGRTGIIVFQAFQGIGIIGGPRGYMLVLNTAISELVAARDRTAVFGKLQGSTTLGTAIGYLLGGVIGDVYNIRRPFEVAFFCFIACSTYGAIFIPRSTSGAAGDSQDACKAKAKADFFAPLKIIVPHQYRLTSGRIVTNYGLIFLSAGIFLGVLATGYAPTMLQMYGTTEFNFSTTENGWLMAGNSFIRGIFLYFMFPQIIAAGRQWLNGPEQKKPATSPEGTDTEEDEEDAGTQFDLLFLRYSLLIDAAVTTLAGFSSEGWQVHLAAYLLPFTSGSAPAAKGVMTEMCPPGKRRDAIASITLVESASMLITQGCFGYIYSAFAEIGHTNLTFFCNAVCLVPTFSTRPLLTLLTGPRFPRRLCAERGDVSGTRCRPAVERRRRRRQGLMGGMDCIEMSND